MMETTEPKLVTFRNQTSVQNTISKQLNKTIVYYSNSYDEVDEYNWKSDQMNSILPDVLQWNIKSFVFNFLSENMGKDKTNILRTIQNIKFNALMYLKVTNKLQSVEGVNKIQAPLVEEIIFNNNKITNISSLRKGVWKCLKVLSLQSNQIIESKAMLQICTSQLTMLDVSKNPEMIDFLNMCRLDSRKLSFIFFPNRDMIRVEKMKKIFLKKTTLFSNFNDRILF